MDIKANMKLFNRPEGNLKAIGTISINDDFIVRGVRVVDGENGLFVAMPSQKVGDGYRDVCFPKSAELREEINSKVLEAYEQTLAEEQGQNQEAEETKKGAKKGRTQKSHTESEQANEDMQEEPEEAPEEGPVMSM